MSFKNNFVPVDYSDSYLPRSLESVYVPYYHNCPNPKNGSPNNPFALTVPFMNSIAAPNQDNNHIATIYTAKNNLPNFSNHHRSIYSKNSSNNFFPIRDNDSHLLYSNLLPNGKESNLSKYQEYNTPSVEQFYDYKNSFNQQINNCNLKKTNSNVNTFPLAWTCYKDNQGKWCCPLRGDKCK